MLNVDRFYRCGMLAAMVIELVLLAMITWREWYPLERCVGQCHFGDATCAARCKEKHICPTE